MGRAPRVENARVVIISDGVKLALSRTFNSHLHFERVTLHCDPLFFPISRVESGIYPFTFLLISFREFFDASRRIPIRIFVQTENSESGVGIQNASCVLRGGKGTKKKITQNKKKKRRAVSQQTF